MNQCWDFWENTHTHKYNLLNICPTSTNYHHTMLGYCIWNCSGSGIPHYYIFYSFHRRHFSVVHFIQRIFLSHSKTRKIDTNGLVHQRLKSTINLSLCDGQVPILRFAAACSLIALFSEWPRF